MEPAGQGFTRGIFQFADSMLNALSWFMVVVGVFLLNPWK